MPTKKRRVGFIPRSDVLDLLNKLSFESNLSTSKVINILVEEALHKRGIYNIKTGKVLNDNQMINSNIKNQIQVKNLDKDTSYQFNNFKITENQYVKEASEEFIDMEIYTKFLMFLQFQEKIKKSG
tara:strand:- start:160 stop:537 length:378 start_codon:yes stop_codon:yes gene_type:complete